MSGNTEKADGGWAGLARDQRSAFWQALLAGTAGSLGEANSFHPRRPSVTKSEVLCLQEKLRRQLWGAQDRW